MLSHFFLVDREPGKALPGCLGAPHCPAGGGTAVIIWKAGLTCSHQSPWPGEAPGLQTRDTCAHGSHPSPSARVTFPAWPPNPSHPSGPGERDLESAHEEPPPAIAAWDFYVHNSTRSSGPPCPLSLFHSLVRSWVALPLWRRMDEKVSPIPSGLEATSGSSSIPGVLPSGQWVKFSRRDHLRPSGPPGQ